MILMMPMCSTRKKFDGRFFEMGVRQGALDNPEIDEASGLAASIANPGMFWTHNDSGDEPRIFLIDGQARNTAVVRLDGISNRDWEDISVGPGPEAGKSYIYVGEIGDNRARDNYKFLYRIEEPALPQGSSRLDTTIHTIDSIKFTLEGGPRDTEALIVDPLTQDIYIFSKNEKKSIRMFRLPHPQSTSAVTQAQYVMSIPLVKICAADISPDGSEILLKNYTHVYYWRREENESISEALKRSPASLPYTTEPQGEAVTFDRGGKGYYTLSEENNNKKPYLLFYERKPEVANRSRRSAPAARDSL